MPAATTSSGSSDNTPEELQRRFKVHGRVQGVGFRWWTRSEARRLGISGDVRNQPDGTVEVRARGSATALQEFETLLNEGAPGASVSRVDEEPADAVPTTEFEIA